MPPDECFRLDDDQSIHPLRPADLRSVAEKWKPLPPLLDAARSGLESVHGARHAALMRRTADDAVISLEGLARFREAPGKSRPPTTTFVISGWANI
jgi:hypothetical protein